MKAVPALCPDQAGQGSVSTTPQPSSSDMFRVAIAAPSESAVAATEVSKPLKGDPRPGADERSQRNGLPLPT